MGKGAKKQIPLIPMTEFQEALSNVLSTTKEESDNQLSALQASNSKRRTGARRGKKPKK